MVMYLADSKLAPRHFYKGLLQSVLIACSMVLKTGRRIIDDNMVKLVVQGELS
jgi:hypothetical protein